MVDKLILEQATHWFATSDFEPFDQAMEASILKVLQDLMDAIPLHRRASYGIVSVIALYCKAIHKELNEKAYAVGLEIYRKGSDFRVIALGLGLLSHIGVKEPQKILPIMKAASSHEVWEIKEFVQMFIRKITKAHKALVKDFLLTMADSHDPNHRRFASEALRPVVENKWIHDQPEYSLEVLRKLFQEPEEFPRLSVANNLSDLSRKNPDLIYKVVQELKGLDDPNSDFIAYRACRNLVKSNPLRVMDLLEVDHYQYKKISYDRRNL